MKLKFGLAIMLLIALSAESFSATRKVSGRIMDSGYAPIGGAAVLIKGSTVGVLSMDDGTFEINVEEGSALVVSCMGYQDKDVIIGSDNFYTVILEDDSKYLDEVVVVGYGSQKKVTLTGSVSAIGNEDIVKSKNENVQNMLTGKIAGLRVVQYSAEPGAFKSEFNIRGLGTPLIIIDGIPRDNMERLDANDIESISVLKDASAAIYGVKAANGVILITTKSGKNAEGKVSLTYSGNFTWQYIAGLPETVDALTFMQMDNEKGMNVSTGGAWRFTQEEMDKYFSGELKSVDWYNNVVRNAAPQTNHNININGGNERTQYYASLGYQYQDSFFRSRDYNYNRYNLRANINSAITDNLSMSVRMNGIMDTKNASSVSSSNIIYYMWRQYPVTQIYENGVAPYFTRFDNKPNPVQMMDADQVGYNRIEKKWIQTSVSLKWNIPFVEGLNVRAEVSYDYNLTNQKQYEKEYNYYNYDVVGEKYVPTTLNSPSKLTRSFSDRKALLYSFSVNYERTFRNGHHANVLLLSESQNKKGDGFYASREVSIDVDELFAGNTLNQVGSMNPSSRYEYANQSFVGRVNYDYKSKYIVEAAMRCDASSRFARTNRWGFFPSASLGYRISEENFWKNNGVLRKINNFKVRASYGIMGDDNALDYQFLAGYTYPAVVENHKGSEIPGGYSFDGVYVNGIMSSGIPNYAITWYRAITSDVGFDIDIWHGMLGASFDWFRRDRTGLLATSETVLPGTVGATLPQENLNSDRTTGFELEISHNNHFGDFYYSVKANMALTRTMTLFRQHSDYRSHWEEWKNGKDGRFSNIWWGLGTGGQYGSWDEIAEFGTFTSRSYIPGDYYYEDWNGDGFIDESDVYPIGFNSTPLFNYGIDVNMSWKGIDLNILFQGAAMSNVAYGGMLRTPLDAGKSAPLTMFKDRWRPVDPNADPYDQFTEWIPGKYAMMGSSSPDETSEMNMYDSRYIRLKNLEVGYTFPAKWTRKVSVESLRIYFNAYNLLTFSPLDFVDPEHPSSDSYMYPLNRTISLGINCKF